MTKKDKIDKIARLCSAAGCSEKLRKLHFEKFVYHDWHPHPPDAFVAWWARHPDNAGEPGVGAVVAFNSQRHYDQFTEARALGLLDETPKAIFTKGEQPF